MDFTEKIKKEVRKKAMSKCCFCQGFDIHIHHIVPGGSNDISNGAPLCPTCHERFGNDSKKRKRIIEARDNWYDRVERMYPDNRELNRQEDLSTKLDKLQQNQISLDDFKHVLKEFSNETINNMTLGTAVPTASGIANASISPSMSPSASPSPSLSPSEPTDEVHANVICGKCDTKVGLLVGFACPTCGELITG